MYYIYILQKKNCRVGSGPSGRVGLKILEFESGRVENFIMLYTSMLLLLFFFPAVDARAAASSIES